MSFKATIWAFEQDIKPATTKFVLVALARYANESDACCYPSVKAICHLTSLDRKTVLAAMTRLQEIGLVLDTGRRVGKTGQVRVFQLNGVPADNAECQIPLQKRNPRSPKKDDLGWGQFIADNDPESGTVETIPETAPFNDPESGTLNDETVPFFPSKSPENGIRNLSGNLSNNNNNNNAHARAGEGEDGETADSVLARVAGELPLGDDPPAEPAKRKAKRKPVPQVTWDGERLSFTDEKRQRLPGMYPHVDLKVEILKAEDYLIGATRTYTNHEAFLANWLQRAEEREKLLAKAKPKAPSGPPPKRGRSSHDLSNIEYGENHKL